MKHLIFLFLMVVLMALVGLSALTPTAQARSDPTLFSGWSRITAHISRGKCIHPDRIHICRGQISEVQIEANDPRLSGNANFIYESRFTTASVEGRVRGEFYMSHPNGSWQGFWKGRTDKMGSSLFTGIASGSGEYENLTARWRMEGSGSPLHSRMALSGSIVDDSRATRRR